MSDRVLVVYKDRYDGVTRSLKIRKTGPRSRDRSSVSSWPHRVGPRSGGSLIDRAATVPLFRDWNPERSRPIRRTRGTTDNLSIRSLRESGRGAKQPRARPPLDSLSPARGAYAISDAGFLHWSYIKEKFPDLTDSTRES